MRADDKMRKREPLTRFRGELSARRDLQFEFTGPAAAEAQHLAGWAERHLDLKSGTGPWHMLTSAISFEKKLRRPSLHVTSWLLRDDLRLTCGTVPAMFDRERAA